MSNSLKQSLVFIFFWFFTVASGQQIVSGPMLGYNTMREVAIWVQVKDESQVKIIYWTENDKSNSFTSTTLQTKKAKANTATIPLTNLEPNTKYNYQIAIDETTFDHIYTFTTQSLWHWRDNPPNFSFLAGSCNYINEKKYDRPSSPYGKTTSIFKTMAEEDAKFMIWLGDNIYLREADWNSRSGIYHRYTHTRSTEDMQPLLSNMHHYAIWDDHDYGPNNSDWSYWNKEISKEAFMDFWANPNYEVAGLESITGTFTWNDCQFFLLDNRWYRTEPKPDGKILGDEQLEWLIAALKYSKANFKFICIGGQVLSNLPKYENYEIYKEEKAKLMSAIDAADLKNIIFITGDRHHSEVSKTYTSSGNPIYDITSSPLTSTYYDHKDEKNFYRLDKDAIIGENNYAHFEVTGKIDKRKVKVIFKNREGNIIQSYMLD